MGTAKAKSKWPTGMYFILFSNVAFNRALVNSSDTVVQVY